MRYLPHTDSEIKEMLKAVGASGLDQLFESIPKDLQLNRPLNIPPSLSEPELKKHLRDLSRKNAHGDEWSSFLGGGAYSHTISSAVSQLLLRGEFLTAYTPYQPEVSQGTLQAIFEYQTMVAEILGMEVANASHYDGSTGTAEAVLMAVRQTKRSKVLVGRSLNPQYRDVLKTYVRNQEIELVEIPFTNAGTLDRDSLSRLIDDKTACVVAAYPNYFGVIDELADVAQKTHNSGALFITVTTEPLALGLVASPGEMGADLAVAEGQSLGIPISFGGPGLGLFASKKDFLRAIPGRLVGETVDNKGRRGYVLTLATREQHIRRERATSNICTNVSLCALAATITLSLWGKSGFRELAQLNYHRANEAKERLSRIKGVKSTFSGTTFNEFAIQLPKDSEKVLDSLLSEKIFAGIPLKRSYPELKDSLLVCVTEMNSDGDVERLAKGLEKAL